MPYRHSVWIDVFGVVFLLALLLGPLAYLATSMLSGGGGGGGAIAGRSSGSAPPPAATQRGFRSSGGPTPVAGLSSPGVSLAGRLGQGPSVPFSEGWREQATPDLTGSAGPTARGGAGAAGGAETGAFASAGGKMFSGGPSSGARARRTGPTGRFGGLALAGRVPAAGGGLAANSRFSGRGWTEEAQSAARTGQRLVGEIGRMTGASGGTTAEQSDSGPGSPDDPERRNPGSPSDVPIDDHLHWLLVAGVLWGVWRLYRG